MREHRASCGESEAEGVAPTKVPSLKPSGRIAFLVAMAKHVTRAPPGSVCWLIVWEYSPLWDGRLKQETHGAPTVGKQRKVPGVVCFMIVVQSRISAYGDGVVCSWPRSLLQLSLPGNTLTGTIRGIVSDLF